MKLSATAPLKVGDKTYTLVLNMNALCEIEETMDANIMSDQTFWENMGFRKLRAVLHALLHKENPRPTVDEVGEIMSAVEIEEIGEAITSLWATDSDKSGAAEAKNAPDPTKG